MTRSARWSIANGLYHVMNRGVVKCDIVKDDHDRQEWMRLLNRVAQRLRNCHMSPHEDSRFDDRNISARQGKILFGQF